MSPEGQGPGIAGPRSRRVLHLITNLSRGGAETQLGHLGVGLVRLGWDVHVGHLETDWWHCTAGWQKERLRQHGVVLHSVTRSHRDLRLLPRLVRLIRRLRPGVVQTWLPAMDFAGGLAALGCGVPWVVSERTSPAFIEEGIRGRLRTALASRARGIVSNSQDADAYWARRAAPGAVRAVVRNALDLDAMAQVGPADRASLHIPSEARLVVYVGRLNEGKNIANLLEALARVVKARPVVALLCGFGPLEGFVEAFVAERGLADRILAPGFLPDVWSWIRAADVFVSPSRFEGMPNAVMEAMALGCPVVVSDIPSHREVLAEDEALFVPCEDASAIAAALERVLDAPGEAAARAARARARAGAWSIEALAARHARVYESIASR
jgi:glycosyltransferase involved in cell wall biosynthesis